MYKMNKDKTPKQLTDRIEFNLRQMRNFPDDDKRVLELRKEIRRYTDMYKHLTGDYYRRSFQPKRQTALYFRRERGW